MPNSIFANARAAALSVRLPGAERLNRMADCSSAEDAVKILQEAGFGEGAASSDPETLIAAEERSFAAFVRDAAPDGRVARFLLARWDFANAEAVMRAKYLKRDAKTMAGTEGVYPLALLEELWEKYPASLTERYGIEGGAPLAMYETLCRRRGFVLRGGEYDLERGARGSFRSSGDGRLHVRKLMAACYLITGQCCQPAAQTVQPQESGWAQLLREFYHEESCDSINYRRAAEETTDLCLAALFRELGEESQTQAVALFRELTRLMGGAGG